MKSETDPYLSAWYKANSLIYVSPDHACWTDEDASRKVKKQRFGGVKKAEVSGLNAMMRRYLVEAGEWITEKVEEKEGEGDDTEDELAGDEGMGNGRRPMMLGASIS